VDNRVVIVPSDKISVVASALSSRLRRRMLRLLYHKRMNVNDIARELQVAQSTAATNILVLERAGLIRTEQAAATRGSQKLCTSDCEEIILGLVPEEVRASDTIIETAMPVGLYTDYKAATPCGLLSSTGVIGYFDNVESFLSPHRATAQLAWFSKGWLEYRFPRNIPACRTLRSVSVSAEVCSEFPGSNPEWPSDITAWVNGVAVGTWTSPGDMGDKRGVLTPEWWALGDSQYGFLKTWTTTAECSFVDGIRCSDTTLDDLAIGAASHVTVRIGVTDDAANCGGMNIFGSRFGNYEKDIVLRLELEKRRRS
jgi:predicted transcriptional regulator